MSQNGCVSALKKLKFDNRFTMALPSDDVDGSEARQVVGACYSRVKPAVVQDPKLIAFSDEISDLLGIAPEEVKRQEFVEILAGNNLLAGMDTHAACYGGHQFGHWAGQLGDGRAIALGEVVDINGRHQMLQLKGAGPTPYSRSADGLAVLRSSIREFLCSEAMHHLGVPTTRALSLVSTGEEVIRDILYDGNPRPEPGAIVCRVAPTFIRFGNFEIFAARGDHETLRQLADFTIATEFPDIDADDPDRYVALLRQVVERTADMIVEWLRVGFVHGVMNTDNMSILGLTIDYGPYGWLDNYDPNWTPNTTDAQHRRYRFGNQPAIGQWNLVQLANALFPLVEKVEPLQEALELYGRRFDSRWSEMMAKKLGLPSLEDSSDQALAEDALNVLQTVETDMTIFWRELSSVSCLESVEPLNRVQPLMRSIYDLDRITEEQKAVFIEFVENWAGRQRVLGTSEDVRRSSMDATNPKYVLRNYMAQVAIERAEQGDTSLVQEFLDLLKSPYAEQQEKDTYYALRPDWARTKTGCSQLSCSS
ncbi:MAG TPA: YdiU family protein [Acidimicrobiaceae bacterium]|nr:YdiU family protein [Acidimicrobiaceae bacterium]